MRALLEVALRRLLARRVVQVLGLVLVATLAAAPPLVDWAFGQRARIEREADLERCVAAEPPKGRAGLTVATIPPGVTGPAERARQCDAAIPPRDATFRLVEVGDVLRPAGALLILAAFALGATAAGADWQGGFVPTVLAWEGRRRRVAVVQAAAVAGAAAAAVLVWTAALTAVLAGMAAVQDATAGAGGPWLRATAGLGLRIAAAAAAAATAGHAVAMLGRGTAAALGAGLGWVLVLESVVNTNLKSLRPWLVLSNAVVFVKGQFEGGPGGDVPGRTVTAAGALLAAYVVALAITSAEVFARRDVP